MYVKVYHVTSEKLVIHPLLSTTTVAIVSGDYYCWPIVFFAKYVFVIFARFFGNM